MSEPKKQSFVVAPTEAQLKYARDLGIKVPPGASKGQVSHLITLERRQMGRFVLRHGAFEVDSLLQHPKRGLCKIVKINRKTLKVTLLVFATNSKIVVDAASLTDYTKLY